MRYSCAQEQRTSEVGSCIKPCTQRGAAMSGCWVVLDEFNRITIPVISIFAQQLTTVFTEINRQRGGSEPSPVPINGVFFVPKPEVGIFLTMNPGYAGRTQMPDDLKTHYRTMAMVIPDFRMIQEVMLYAEGFRNAHELARKSDSFFQIAHAQLSKQNHYDFGMRKRKQTMAVAGKLLRESQKRGESLGDDAMWVAHNSTIASTLLAEDLPLYQNLLLAFCPGFDFQRHEESQPELVQSVRAACD